MSVKLESTITQGFVVSNPTTDEAVDADSLPTVEVFEENNDTPLTVAGLVVAKRTSKTGVYRITIPCTAANGFEAGKDYDGVVSAIVSGGNPHKDIFTFSVAAVALDDVSGRIPAALVSGKMDSFLSDKTGFSLSSAEEIALVNLIWNELTSESRTVGSYGQLLKDDINVALSALATPAQVLAQVRTALETDTIPELPVAAPPATPTIKQALMWAYMMRRNLRIVSATEDKIFNDSGAVIAKSTGLSAIGGIFTRTEYVAGP